ncbi:hypothetical protein LPB86_19955 [Pedobacter sp. MC2016-14]|uniref:MutS-related protein n=1 Tax=Pedobacter sp. MC2016-14 TaxID=2897327 RepID=UPI001E5B6FD9|nr:hypothetical protein [Pedobacter sp. MC2016-14]MCD0490524.1 hypothetical protein [Pedobacter sp. MC2016-14]
MNFSTDQQTLNDLNIIGKPGSSSVYNLFNHTYTRGGADLLEKMFLYPLADAAAINKRSGIFQHFSSIARDFPFKTEHLDGAELYLSMTDERTRLSETDQSLTKKFSQLVSADGDYQLIYNGITALLELIHTLNNFVESTLQSALGTPYESSVQSIKNLFADPDFVALLKEKQGGKLVYVVVAAYDHLLRFKHRAKIKEMLLWIYDMDVCFSVAKVALKHQFVFPEALAKDAHAVKLAQLYHPLVKHAVANNLEIDPGSNIIFLTGANMAGKSTFMKSLGIAMYLAHMGFPVAAASMQFSVRDGIYTTINLPDDLSSGNSHFYAEVLRVKKIAKELSVDKNLFIIFDELFRGTNVKDACEGTIAITSAFARKRNCMFVVSSHIIEAAEVLKAGCSNVNFVYLPTLMEGNKPIYTYTLKAGITADRHGMIIVNNEGVLGLLENGIRSLPSVRDDDAVRANGIKHFIADKQTLEDLNIVGRYKTNSIFRIFDHTVTAGGSRLMEQMFQQPLADAAAINERSNIFKYFTDQPIAFPFNREEFELMENYLRSGTAGNMLSSGAGIGSKWILHLVAQDNDYEILVTEVVKIIALLQRFDKFMLAMDVQDNPYRTEQYAIKNIFDHRSLSWMRTIGSVKELSLLKLIRYDFLLRGELHQQMQELSTLMYWLDLYIAVAKVARDKGFCYAKASPGVQNILSIERLYHPALENAIGNSVNLSQGHNVLFLTGANMAGKSTLMKSFGISLYLAHMGFPVAADRMEFSVKDGLYTSINVPDNINRGHSHYFAEVLRVKKVAEEVSAGKKLVAIFDELFKGTNVKDAFDATLSITEAFSKNKDCFFVVSTHITEVAEALQRSTDNFQFSYLPTVIDGNTPRYTYKLQQGITTDRQGMMIIENEGILELLTRD